MEPVRIGVAVVEHQGRFLVGIRRKGQVLEGRAEFPGGKCQAQETAANCAERECLEETGLTVTADRLLDRRQHEYPHGLVALEFWLCRVTGPADPARGFRWADRRELTRLPFPEANQHVIEQLAAESR